MAKKWKKSNANKPAAKNQPGPIGNPPVSTSNVKPVEENQPTVAQKTRGSIVPWIALVVALGSACGTIVNAINNSRSYDRTAGKTRAKIELVEANPKQENTPVDLQELSPITDQKEITLKEVNDILRLNPRVKVKNVGDEPIDGIRLETRVLFSFIDMVGQPAAKQRMPNPWVMNEVAREDFSLSEKLMPGKVAEIRISKNLLSLIAQLQARDKEDRLHYGQFQTQCMAKLVGGTAYDGTGDQKAFTFRFAWLPKGFPDEKCQKILQEFKASPAVEP